MEPFKLFGDTSIISAEKEAYEVIKRNSYYLYLYAYIHILYSFIFLYSSKLEDVELLTNFTIYLIFGIIFLIFSYIIKKYLNRIILSIYIIFPVLSIVYSTGFILILQVFTLMAMLRSFKAINFIKKIIQEEIKKEMSLLD